MYIYFVVVVVNFQFYCLTFSKIHSSPLFYGEKEAHGMPEIMNYIPNCNRSPISITSSFSNYLISYPKILLEIETKYNIIFTI